MKNVIYKIRNVVNNNFYVGSTVNSRKRFWTHRKALRLGMHDSIHLQRAWDKYGEDCFKFEVVEQLNNKNELYPAEQKWLNEHFGKDYCYNCSASANTPMRNASSEMRARLAQKTKEWLGREGHPRQGTVHTSEAIELMIINNRAPKGEAHYRYGKTVNDETKAKISATMKGRPNPMKGKKMSEQGRLNVAAAAKRGEESPLYGKRPANADELQKPIHATLPDLTTQTFVSLSAMRDSLGISIATIIRACKFGKPIRFGAYAGWVLSYAEGHRNEGPEIPEEYLSYPRSRQEAKTSGAKHYFTGVPCDRGHIALRKAKGTCVACMKEDYKKDNDRRKSNKLG